MYSFAVLSTLLATAFAAAVPSGRVNYDGYQVVRISTAPAGDDEVTIQNSVQNIVKELKLEPLMENTGPGSNVDLMIPPKQIKSFELLSGELNVQVLHEDLGADIAAEGALLAYEDGSSDDAWFQAYHSYDDHMKWLADLERAYPDNSRVVAIGASHEHRNMTGIHIYGKDGRDTKPAAVFHGTIHAREWITTMVTEYIANSLLSGYESDPDVKSIVDKYDIYFFPIANPDGFVFTQENDRMWRKNRQPHETNDCAGRDLNRNWPYEWEGEGSSPDPCSESFRGEEPGDAPENKVHTDFIQKLADENGLKIFIDFHSYSQLFMSPYGYSCTELPQNDDLHQNLSSTFATALAEVHGTEYTTGPICSTIYPANGNSVDWIVDVAGGEMAFAAELRDTGENGFILPPDQILPSGEETWAGFKALMMELK